MSSKISTYSSVGIADTLEVGVHISDPPGPQTRTKDRACLTTVANFSHLETNTDEELLLHTGNGHRQALSLLFHRHARSVYAIARRILKDDSEAEDLVQDLFIFVFQRAKYFDPVKASGASWIIQMAYHRAIDRRRYLGFRQHYNAQELQDEDVTARRTSSLIDQLSGRELLNKLRAELPTEQTQTLELHLFEGYSFHEIAEKTGQTFGNVRNHYYRAIERLRSHIFRGKSSRSERIGTQ